MSFLLRWSRQKDLAIITVTKKKVTDKFYLLFIWARLAVTFTIQCGLSKIAHLAILRTLQLLLAATQECLAQFSLKKKRQIVWIADHYLLLFVVKCEGSGSCKILCLKLLKTSMVSDQEMKWAVSKPIITGFHASLPPHCLILSRCVKFDRWTWLSPLQSPFNV